MNRFVATSGGVEVNLQPTEVAILSRLGSLLGAAGVEKSDPARARLNPVLYRDDVSASREFDRLVSKERVEARSADRERFAETLRDALAGPIVLSVTDAAVWARVIGQARVVVAARKGLFDAGLPEEPPADPEVALVMLLGYLQDELVEQMLIGLEETL